MKPVKIHEAKTQFSRLIALVEQGEEVTIQRGDVPVAKLVPFGPPLGGRKAGMLKDQITIGPNFDDPLPEFEPYM